MSDGASSCLPGAPGAVTTIASVDLGDGSVAYDGPFILDVEATATGAAILYGLDDQTGERTRVAYVDDHAALLETVDIYGSVRVDGNLTGSAHWRDDILHVAVGDQAKAVYASIAASTSTGVSGTRISSNNYLAINDVTMLDGIEPFTLVYQHYTSSAHVLSGHGPRGTGEDLLIGTWSLDPARRLVGLPQVVGQASAPWAVWLETSPRGCLYWMQSCGLSAWALPLRAGSTDSDATEIATGLPVYDWARVDTSDAYSWLARADGALLAINSAPHGNIELWRVSTTETIPAASLIRSIPVGNTLERFLLVDVAGEPHLQYLTEPDASRCCLVTETGMYCDCREGHIAGQWWDIAATDSSSAVNYFDGALGSHFGVGSKGAFVARVELAAPTANGADPTEIVVQLLECRE